MALSWRHKHLHTYLDIVCIIRLVAIRSLLYKEFGFLLAQERKRKHLTQANLGAQAGLSRTSITNIECGRQPIQLHQLYAFAKILRVDAQTLLPKESILTPNNSSSRSEQEELVRSRFLDEVKKLLIKPRKSRVGGDHGK